MPGGRRPNSGPKPKPAALKRLQGNPGHRPIVDDVKPKRSLPQCPTELGYYAKREWRRITPELYRLGLLTPIDRAALAAYCASYGSFIEAEGALRRDPDDQTERRLRLISRKSCELMLRYLVEFGMSPSSRSRVRAADIAEAARVPADEAFLAARGLRVIK